MAGTGPRGGRGSGNGTLPFSFAKPITPQVQRAIPAHYNVYASPTPLVRGHEYTLARYEAGPQFVVIVDVGNPQFAPSITVKTEPGQLKLQNPARIAELLLLKYEQAQAPGYRAPKTSVVSTDPLTESATIRRLEVETGQGLDVVGRQEPEPKPTGLYPSASGRTPSTLSEALAGKPPSFPVNRAGTPSSLADARKAAQQWQRVFEVPYDGGSGIWFRVQQDAKTHVYRIRTDLIRTRSGMESLELHMRSKPTPDEATAIVETATSLRKRGWPLPAINTQQAPPLASELKDQLRNLDAAFGSRAELGLHTPLAFAEGGQELHHATHTPALPKSDQPHRHA